MKNKILIFTSIVLILALGFIVMNRNYVASDNKYVKGTCTNSAGCTKNHDVRAGGDVSTYEFVTDKACTDEERTAMQSALMNVTGVNDVKFGPSCSVSKMSNVTIYYSPDKTSSDNLASFVKDKQMDCSKMGNCPPGSCPHKDKTKESKSSNI
jgi:hypothetical protein